MTDRTPASNQDLPSESPTAPSTHSSNWLAISASVISLIGVVLALLGYGVSLAVEGIFGVPHAALVENGFDLLDLASIGLMSLLEEGLPALGRLDLYLRLYASAWPILVALIAAWLIFMVWLWRRKVPQKFAPPISALAPSKATLEKKRITRERVLAVVALFLIPITPLLAVAGVWLVVVVVAILTVIPVVGMSAGVTHVEQWVMAPTRCMPRLNRDQCLNRPGF